MYLYCPECRLTVYRAVEQSADEPVCPRCGGVSVWSSPPFARRGELTTSKADRSRTAPAR